MTVSYKTMGTCHSECRNCGGCLHCDNDVGGEDELLKGLEDYRRIYKMLAITREAFVGQIVHKITIENFDYSKLWAGLLGKNKGPAIDIESCRALLDEEFANKAIDLAVELIKKHHKSV